VNTRAAAQVQKNFSEGIGSFPKNIVMKLARNIKGKLFVKSFVDQLCRYMAGRPKNVTALREVGDILSNNLKDGVAKENTLLSFRIPCSKGEGHVMVISVDGKEAGTIDSKEICEAFVGCFINSISPALKEDMTKNFWGNVQAQPWYC